MILDNIVYVYISRYDSWFIVYVYVYVYAYVYKNIYVSFLLLMASV